MTTHPDAIPAALQVELDGHRAARRGYAEAVYCEGKSAPQLEEIARQVVATGTPTLFTRIRPDQVDVLRAALPGARYEPTGRIAAWPGEPPAVTGGTVAVLAAGSSDAPVAIEAHFTVEQLGRPAELMIDVGVAGLHRVLGKLDRLREARAIVVVAGMDGALPSVVAGLVSAPVVAVPTSIGYGAALGGIAALLAMLNACAPGVAVVNIDNGYGAGHLAAQIAAS